MKKKIKFITEATEKRTNKQWKDTPKPPPPPAQQPKDEES